MDDHPWLVVDDFNIIQTDHERVGGLPRLILEINEFNACLDSCRLIDMAFKGRCMSWCNDQELQSRRWA